MDSTDEGADIIIGYEWRQQIVWSGSSALFPEEATFEAQIRKTVESTDVLGTLSTGDGTIVREDDFTATLVIAPAVTATLAPSRSGVVLDLVRTDVDPPQYQYVMLQIPVSRPVTRL